MEKKTRRAKTKEVCPLLPLSPAVSIILRVVYPVAKRLPFLTVARR